VIKIYTIDWPKSAKKVTAFIRLPDESLNTSGRVTYTPSSPPDFDKMRETTYGTNTDPAADLSHFTEVFEAKEKPSDRVFAVETLNETVVYKFDLVFKFTLENEEKVERVFSAETSNEGLTLLLFKVVLT